MQKKVLGILAGVVTAHAVLLVGLMAGGGCRQPEILGPHTYNNGPEFTPPAPEKQPAEVKVKKVVDTPPVVNVPKENVPPVVVKPPRKDKPVKPVKAVKKPAQPVKRATATQYKVKKGDSLSLIAYRHGVKTKELAAYNNIPENKINSIREGQILNIPGGGAYKSPKPAPVKKSKTDTKPVTAENGVYVVKSGDALERIAHRHGVSTDALAEANNIKKSSILRPGQKLKIPARGTAVKSESKKAPQTDVKPKKDKDDSDFGLDDLDADLNNASADNNGGLDSLKLFSDMTVKEIAAAYSVPEEVVLKYNPKVPADGKFKKDTSILLPR